jgi:hypothetical protein
MLLDQLNADLEMVRNFQGLPWTERTKEQIRQLVTHPTLSLWNEFGFRAVLGPGQRLADGTLTRAITLGRAVLAVDPSCQRYVTHDRFGGDVWHQVPDPEVIVRAIGYATH